MGKLKESVENIKEDNKELKERVKTLENNLVNTREEFLKNNKQNGFQNELNKYLAP